MNFNQQMGALKEKLDSEVSTLQISFNSFRARITTAEQFISTQKTTMTDIKRNVLDA